MVEFESLVSRCRRAIASNIDRYPVESMGVLNEIEWEEVVKIKYDMTKPKSRVQKVKGSQLLSDGRKTPVFSYKFMKEVEEKNPHFKTSDVIDELVWRDCVDFQFFQRPMIFKEPWNVQVERLKKIARDIPTISFKNKNVTNKSSPSSSSSSSSSSKPPGSACHRQIVNIIDTLKNTAMNVPLLEATKIGIALKKLIKKLRGFDQSTDEIDFSFPIAQLKTLLDDWKQMASANGVDMSSSNDNRRNGPSPSALGRDRNTSPAQHADDIKALKKSAQWRDLYITLVARKQKVIESHGAKMRKIKENLDKGRPKISSASTKKQRGRRMMLNSGGGIQYEGTAAPNKLGKLKQDFKKHTTMIKGGKAASNARTSAGPGKIQKASFGSSVARGTKKRGIEAAQYPNKQPRRTCPTSRVNRQVALPNGKQMKLPRRDVPTYGKRRT